MDISNNLKKIFEELKDNENITASSIATKLKISKKTLSNYINGDAYIPLEHVNNLSNILDISIDYILGLSPTKKYNENKNLITLDSKAIGNRIKEIRKELKLSQDSLAKTIGINKSSISRYENGKNLILTISLYTICQKYHISADYLTGKINQPKYLKK